MSRILNGCVLLEEWTSAMGNSGKSFNVFDPKASRWRQTWVDDRGTQTDYAGAFEGSALVYLANDGKLRMTFTPLEGGKVRQHMEALKDGAWSAAFDGLYVPR